MYLLYFDSFSLTPSCMVAYLISCIASMKLVHLFIVFLIMMQVSHQLGKEVSDVIYVILHTSTPKLAFMVELGTSISYGIRANLCTGR